jgi:hypothetical protein
MADRILKDIRFYESDYQNIDGQSMPHELGKLFRKTSDTNYIGQRIARKLNELKFTYSEFDHIYINLTTFLEENEIVISTRNIDKRIKYIDFGFNSATINSLSEKDRDDFIKVTTFKLLKHISSGTNLDLVNQVERLVAEFDTEIKILYKSKETTAYKIDIYYQIASESSGTQAIIEYVDKKVNACFKGTFKLQFYDDIYPLVDTINLSNDIITLKPKKSFTADIHNERYKTPIALKLNELEKFNCH